MKHARFAAVFAFVAIAGVGSAPLVAQSSPRLATPNVITLPDSTRIDLLAAKIDALEKLTRNQQETIDALQLRARDFVTRAQFTAHTHTLPISEEGSLAQLTVQERHDHNLVLHSPGGVAEPTRLLTFVHTTSDTPSYLQIKTGPAIVP